MEEHPRSIGDIRRFFFQLSALLLQELLQILAILAVDVPRDPELADVTGHPLPDEDTSHLEFPEFKSFQRDGVEDRLGEDVLAPTGSEAQKRARGGEFGLREDQV